MSRKGAREQNDISLIIGTLPKRLQNKIAASCSHAVAAAATTKTSEAEVENAENAEPVAPTAIASRPGECVCG